MFIIRFIFTFCLSFIILCIPVGENRRFFDYLFDAVKPYAEKAVKTTKQKISSTKHYSKKLYSNSEPKHEDIVVKKEAAPIRKKHVMVKDNGDIETYTEEEQLRLKKVLEQE